MPVEREDRGGRGMLQKKMEMPKRCLQVGCLTREWRRGAALQQDWLRLLIKMKRTSRTLLQ